MWFIIFFTIIALGAISFFQFDNLRNVNVNIAHSPAFSSTAEQSVQPMVSAKLQSELNASGELTAPTIVDDVKTTLEPSATLVDIPMEKEKTEFKNDTFSSSKVQLATSSDSKESTSIISKSVVSPAPKTAIKTKASLQNAATKKNANEKENDSERKNKDPLKMHAKTYDNDIALLSALVANTSKSKDDFLGNVNKNVAVKRPSTPSINLDVIERNPGDNTKNLLTRCEKLGGMEAQLCHDRICSGSWQSESACSPTKG